MNKKYTIFVLAILAVTAISTFYFVLALDLDIEASVSQEIVELGETVTLTVKEFELTDRNEWTWHGKVIRYGADGSQEVVAEDSGTVQPTPAGEVVWTVDVTAPSSFPVATYKWHGEVPYLKYVAQVTLKHPTKLIGIGMAKTFILVNKRQDVIDFMNNTMIPAAENLIEAAENEVKQGGLIDQRIDECKTGNKTDQDVATRWEAIKSDIEDIKNDAENIVDLIEIAIDDLTIKNAKTADDEVNNFWVKHGDTRDEYYTLKTLYEESCVE